MAATFQAIGDLTDSIPTPKPPGEYFDMIIEMTGDTSYPTGGYPFGVPQLQALFSAYNGVAFVDVANMAPIGQPATTAYMANYDRVAGKIQFFQALIAVAGTPQPFQEVVAATNVSTAKARVRVRFF